MARLVRSILLVTALAASVLGCGDRWSGPQGSAAVDPESRRATASISAADASVRGAAVAGGEPPSTVAGESPETLDPDPRAVLEQLSSGKIVRARPISRRSLSLRLFLRGGCDAAYKPLLGEKRTARYEVAAFRVSRLLGLDLVPPSVMRRIPVDNFVWMLGEEHAEINQALREQAHLDDRSGVWGATIAWIDGLEPSGMEGSAGATGLKRLLALDGPAFEREPLVADASALVVFDYLTGNWDRFSGGNLFRRTGSGRLVLLDNNGAFAKWSDVKQARMDDLLGLTFRFSRRLIDTVRALTQERVERALELEPWHRTGRLLTRREIDLLLERRDAVVAHVDGLVAEHGASRVLVLP